MLYDKCDSRGCKELGVGHNDDGEWLCEDCMFEWYQQECEMLEFIMEKENETRNTK